VDKFFYVCQLIVGNKWFWFWFWCLGLYSGSKNKLIAIYIAHTRRWLSIELKSYPLTWMCFPYPFTCMAWLACSVTFGETQTRPQNLRLNLSQYTHRARPNSTTNSNFNLEQRLQPGSSGFNLDLRLRPRTLVPYPVHGLQTRLLASTPHSGLKTPNPGFNNQVWFLS
jgi:hypothetical protein